MRNWYVMICKNGIRNYRLCLNIERKEKMIKDSFDQYYNA